MKHPFKKLAALALAAALGISALPVQAAEYQQPTLEARVKDIIEVDGYYDAISKTTSTLAFMMAPDAAG